MLTSQDVMILLKLLANVEHMSWPQNKLAVHLCISSSEVNAGIKRLYKSGLLQPNTESKGYQLVETAIKEFLISGLKYIFPVQLGEYTRGIATSYAAPVFEKKISSGSDPIPVWPYAEGNARGLALAPLYPSVPKSLAIYPDQNFYDFLALIDAIRQGRSRERSIAITLLQKKLGHDN